MRITNTALATKGPLSASTDGSVVAALVTFLCGHPIWRGIEAALILAFSLILATTLLWR